MQDKLELISEKWQEILLHIKQEYELSDVSFKTWLLPTKPYALRQDTLLILVPDKQFLGYIRKKYGVLLQVSVEEITDIPCKVDFVTPEETRALKETVSEVEVAPDVAGYLMDIVEATRRSDRFALGVSTRGALALYHAAQCLAALSGRSFVIPEDISSLAVSVLAHRLSASGSVLADTAEALKKLLSEIPVPLEKL